MKRFSGSAIARHQVFTLADGTFVVQWDDKRVQELYSGEYRDYEHLKDFGHPITDYELKQLQAGGRVEHFNRGYVWLYALPETGRFAVRVMGRGDRVRAYYISTNRSKSNLSDIREQLKIAGVADNYQARLRGGQVVILDHQGLPFRTLDDAEAAQAALQIQKSELFNELAIAFIEIDVKASQRLYGETETEESLNLDEIIASQRDTSTTKGRQIVLAVTKDDERKAFTELFESMEIEVQYASTGSLALELLEDYDPDMLVMDLQLPDMHGWQMLSKIKEIESLRRIPIMLITNEPTLSTTVAQVEYLVRPVSIARLRHSVWKIMHDRITNPRQTSR